VHELVGDRLADCEAQYEASLWMLYGLLDSRIMKTDGMFDVGGYGGGGGGISRRARGEQPDAGEDETDPADPADSPPLAQDTFIRNSCPKICDSIRSRLRSLRAKLPPAALPTPTPLPFPPSTTTITTTTTATATSSSSFSDSGSSGFK
jgi:hypothetical protein